MIWFGVDVEKGRRDAVAFAAAHKAADGTRIVEENVGGTLVGGGVVQGGQESEEDDMKKT